jgi:hypothetical protein
MHEAVPDERAMGLPEPLPVRYPKVRYNDVSIRTS